MVDHPDENPNRKSGGASPPPVLQSKAVRAFLQVLALSIRNIRDADEGLALLDRLEGKAEGLRIREVAQAFGLSPDEVVDVFHLVRILRRRWMEENSLLGQKLDGPPH